MFCPQLSFAKLRSCSQWTEIFPGGHGTEICTIYWTWRQTSTSAGSLGTIDMRTEASSSPLGTAPEVARTTGRSPSPWRQHRPFPIVHSVGVSKGSFLEDYSLNDYSSSSSLPADASIGMAQVMFVSSCFLATTIATETMPGEKTCVRQHKKKLFQHVQYFEIVDLRSCNLWNVLK